MTAGSPLNFVDQAHNIFVVDSPGEHQAINFLLPETGCSSVTVIRLLPPPLIVVSALLGGCNTVDSLPSTGLSEPGPDEAVDPASTLLLVADPTTPLLVARGFPSKPLVVLLDHAARGVGRRVGRYMSRCGGVFLSTRPQRGSTEKKPEQPERTKNKERTRKEKLLLFGRYSVYAVPFWAVFSIGGTFCAISSVSGTGWKGIQCWWYLASILIDRCRVYFTPVCIFATTIHLGHLAC